MAAQQPSDLGYQQALRYAEELRELYETERARRAELEAAHDRLRQTEAKYRTLVEGLPAIVYEAEFGEAGVWRYVSPQIDTILGFTPEEWMADPELWYRQLHPEDKPQALADERRARDTGEPLMSEYRMLSRDGRVVWFRDEAVVLPRHEGEGQSLQGVMYDITDRKHAEEALRRRERILEAVSFAAEEFLRGGAWQENIQEVLARLGGSADASRIYICQNHRAEDGALLQSMRHEWVAPGISPQIDNPAEQSAPYADGFSRWEETLGRGRIIQGHVRDFPAAEQRDLTHEDIRSMAVVPIFVRGEWWGYIGFDECLGEREWSYAELGALKAAADTFGAAIQRQAAEEALQRYTARLESLRKIDLAILAAESTEQLIQSALTRLRSLVPGQRATVSLFHFDAEELSLFATTFTGQTTLTPGVRVPFDSLGPSARESLEQFSRGVTEIEDLAAMPDLPPVLQTVRNEGIRSVLSAPLISEGELIGALSVHAEEPSAFLPEHREIVGEVANQLAIAIRHSRLRQELEDELAERKRGEEALRRYNERLEGLRNIDVAILSAQTIEDLIQAAFSRIQVLVPSRRATVWLMDFEARTATVFVTSTSPDAGLAPGVQYPVERWGSFGESVLQKLRGGDVDLRHDLAEEPDLSPGLQALLDEGIRSLLVVPLLEQGDLMGVFGLYADAPGAFTPEHVEIAREVANQLTIAIRQARLLRELEDELAERTRAEEEATRSEARKSAILESALDCVITMDHDGKILEFNPAAERTFGYQREDVVGKEMAELIIPPSLRQAHREGLARYLATGEGPVLGKRLELTGVRADETEFPVELAIARVDLPGPPVFTGYLRDITERKQAEETLRETLADLRKTDEARQRLLSHLSMAQEEERSRIAGDIHDDTIQVMTAVGMRLDILRRELQLPEQINLLEHLEETVRVATGRLRNLLFELHPPTLDRDGLVAALRVYLEQNREQTGLAYTLEDHLAGEPPAETRVILYRIAQEVLANVRKHARASSLALVVESHEGGFLFRIADDGVGFSVAEDNYQRPGHLGLASIRERAEMAGGWSRIETAPGNGTTVEFWLPEETPNDGRTEA
jgi:PAS domain S-box-containing protein